MNKNPASGSELPPNPDLDLYVRDKKADFLGTLEVSQEEDDILRRFMHAHRPDGIVDRSIDFQVLFEEHPELVEEINQEWRSNRLEVVKKDGRWIPQRRVI